MPVLSHRLWMAFMLCLTMLVIVPIVPQTMPLEHFSILPLRLAVVAITVAILFAPIPTRRLKKASRDETPPVSHAPAQE